jgi:hypothetical protein
MSPRPDDVRPRLGDAARARDRERFLDDVRSVVSLVAGAVLAAGLVVALASAVAARSLALPWPEVAQRSTLWLGVVTALLAGLVVRTCGRRVPGRSRAPARCRRDAARGRSGPWRRSTGAASASRST